MSTVTELNWMGGSLTNAAKTEYSEGVSVKDKIDAVVADVDAVKAKILSENMLPNKAKTTTMNGVTFTVNDDGTVLVDGTATADAFIYVLPDTKDFNFGEDYILNGCPADGALGKYSLAWRIGNDAGNTYVDAKMDFGEGVTLQNYDASSQHVRVTINISSGFTANNLLFKPMIRHASIENDTYVQYFMNNVELTADRVNYVKNGANEAGITISPFENGLYAGAQVYNDVHQGLLFRGYFTDDEDGDYCDNLIFNRAVKQIVHSTYNRNTASWTQRAVYTADEDTGWVELENSIAYRKKNGVVYVRCNNTTSELTATETTIATLPAGCRPSVHTCTVGYAYGSNAILTMYIRPNGQIVARTVSGTATGLSAMVSFPV